MLVQRKKEEVNIAHAQIDAKIANNGDLKISFKLLYFYFF